MVASRADFTSPGTHGCKSSVRMFFAYTALSLGLTLLASSASAEDSLGPTFDLAQVQREFNPHQSKDTGTLFFECKLASCGIGSTVSEHPQGNTYLSNATGLDQFAHEWLDGIRGAMPDKDVRGEVFKTAMGHVSAGQNMSDSFALALVQLSSSHGKLEGVDEWWAVGFLSNGAGSMTFASSSDTSDMAWRNANGIMAFNAAQKP